MIQGLPFMQKQPAERTLDVTSDNFLRYDGPAGAAVFLVALPLCLGIALASGAPLFAGLIAGIVGGIVVGALSGSQVSVSGPAAGLAVIVAAAIQHLGSYPAFLLAVMLSGGIQFAFGMARFGIIADYVPNSVIKGMLSAIGIVIILKQIPHALGRDNDYEGDFSFLEANGLNTLSDLMEAVVSASPGAIVISVVSILPLIFWDRLAARWRFFQVVPGPLMAVLLGICLNQAFGLWAPALQLIQPEHLVTLPAAVSLSDFFRQLTLPDFSAITNQAVWITAATIAVVGGLETLLSLEAADRLDPFKRISPPNRELRAQGVGNVISGLLGGLPITSVVVRTSANVYAGARTRMSTILHGVLLLAAVVLIPGVLRMAPLASLAAILMSVGYKLTKPSIYTAAYRLGWDQFIPFLTTVVAVVFTDLLKGVLVGLLCGVFFLIRTNHYEAIMMVNEGSDYLIRFTKDASFVNKSEFRTKLRELPSGSRVIIDGTRALFIDHDIMEVVQDFQKMAPYKNIQIELKQWDSVKL